MKPAVSHILKVFYSGDILEVTGQTAAPWDYTTSWKHIVVESNLSWLHAYGKNRRSSMWICCIILSCRNTGHSNEEDVWTAEQLTQETSHGRCFSPWSIPHFKQMMSAVQQVCTCQNFWHRKDHNGFRRKSYPLYLYTISGARMHAHTHIFVDKYLFNCSRQYIFSYSGALVVSVSLVMISCCYQAMKIKQWMEKMKDREQWRLIVEEAKAYPGL
jgi:hypothetical protein